MTTAVDSPGAEVTGYVDSGVLVKLYVREPNSEEAAREVSRFPFAPLTPLHELEIRNTFRALQGRGAITDAQRAASEHVFEMDIAAGRLRRIVPDWTRVFADAEGLSRDFTTETLARSLELLHVASATNLASSVAVATFVTADRRQALIAEQAGFRTRFVV
jgi:predicted nucleic acid-binding protein